jgi:hypothetical protein
MPKGLIVDFVAKSSRLKLYQHLKGSGYDQNLVVKCTEPVEKRHRPFGLLPEISETTNNVVLPFLALLVLYF